MFKYSSSVPPPNLHHLIDFTEEPRKLSTHITNSALNTRFVIGVIDPPYFPVVVIKYFQNALSKKTVRRSVSFMNNRDCLRGYPWVSCKQSEFRHCAKTSGKNYYSAASFVSMTNFR